MAILISDDFNRADGALGPNWTSAGTGSGMTLVSNQARAQDNFLDNFAYYNSPLLTADYEVEADLSMVHASEYADGSVLGRYLDTNNYYEARMWIFGDEIQLYKRVAGVETSLGVLSFAFSRNTVYNIRLAMVGTSLKVYVDDVLKIDTTDGDLTSAGYAGIWATGHASAYESFDNFLVTGTVAVNVGSLLSMFQ